jgi:transcriptional regulator with XRE-family HTH domain
VMRGLRGLDATIPERQSATVGVNIRTLRQRKGWTQTKLGELMGWQSGSTMCAAEGHRDGRQRNFTTEEVERLAAIFGIAPHKLTTRCANCDGQPPAGFACLACGTALRGDGTPAPVLTGALTYLVQHEHAETHR